MEEKKSQKSWGWIFPFICILHVHLDLVATITSTVYVWGIETIPYMNISTLVQEKPYTHILKQYILSPECLPSGVKPFQNLKSPYLGEVKKLWLAESSLQLHFYLHPRRFKTLARLFVLCVCVCACVLQLVTAQQNANLLLRRVWGEFEDKESKSVGKEETWKHFQSQIVN